MPTDSRLLARVPLFDLLDAEERKTLADQSEEVRFPTGEVIFRRGDPGDALFILRQGAVELSAEDTTGQRVVLETAGPGDFFGELSLLDGEARSSDAIARSDVEAIRVDRADLRSLFRSHPDAALDFLVVMGRRLRASSRLLTSGLQITPNQEVQQRSTPVQRLADLMTEFSGTFTFFLVHALWFAIWILINVGAFPSLAAFDPYPFGLLTMVVSLEAIFLSCMVLISQKREAVREHIRSDVEYEANIKAGLEVTQLHVKIDRLHAEVNKRLQAIERERG
jgi:CRP-like cAMP-binding protein